MPISWVQAAGNVKGENYLHQKTRLARIAEFAIPRFRVLGSRDPAVLCLEEFGSSFQCVLGEYYSCAGGAHA